MKTKIKKADREPNPHLIRILAFAKAEGEAGFSSLEITRPAREQLRPCEQKGFLVYGIVHPGLWNITNEGLTYLAKQGKK